MSPGVTTLPARSMTSTAVDAPQFQRGRPGVRLHATLATTTPSREQHVARTPSSRSGVGSTSARPAQEDIVTRQAVTPLLSRAPSSRYITAILTATPFAT